MEKPDTKESKSRTEIIEEKFFPTRVFSDQPTITPAPPEAVALRDKWREEWLKEHPLHRERRGIVIEQPRVSLGPVVKKGKRGYSVRKEILYPYEKGT